MLTQDYEDIFFFREFEINGVTTSPGKMTPDKYSPNASRSASRASRSKTPNKSSMIGISPDGSRAIF